MRAWMLFLVAGCGGNEVPSTDAGDAATPETGITDSFVNDVAAADVTQDAPVDVVSDVATFSPLSLSGLVLWLDANQSSSITVTNNHVTKWADRTTYHNDATATQNGPTIAPNAINGLPAIHFTQGAQTGNMLTIADAVSLQWGQGDFYIAIVVTFDNDVSGGQDVGVATFYSKLSGVDGLNIYGNVPNQNATPGLGWTAGTATTGVYQAWSGGTFNNGAVHQYAYRRLQGAYISMRLDGTEVLSGYPNSYDVDTPGSVVHVGAEGAATLHRLDGNVGEIVAIKGTIATNDEDALVGYLRAKWNTP